MTFEELSKLPSGAVLDQWEQDGVQCLILRGPAAVCAYVGIPDNNQIAEKGYNSIDLDVHGGLTFDREGKEGSLWAPGYYWLGWDYGHHMDKSFYDFEHPWRDDKSLKGWVTSEVREEVLNACKQLQTIFTAQAWASVKETLGPIEAE